MSTREIPSPLFSPAALQSRWGETHTPAVPTSELPGQISTPVLSPQIRPAYFKASQTPALNGPAKNTTQIRAERDSQKSIKPTNCSPTMVIHDGSFQAKKYFDGNTAPIGTVDAEGIEVLRRKLNRRGPHSVIQALTAVFDPGVPQLERQRAIEEPFEFRAYFGGRLCPHGAPLADYLRSDGQALVDSLNTKLEEHGRGHLRVELLKEQTLLNPQARLPHLKVSHPYGEAHEYAIEDIHQTLGDIVGEKYGYDVQLPPLLLCGKIDLLGECSFPDRPILERFAQCFEDRFQPLPDGFTATEIETIKAWAKEVYDIDVPHCGVHRVFLKLLDFPLHSQRTEVIHKTLDLHAKLGTLSKFSAELFKTLWQRYGSSPEVEQHDFRIGAHLKLDGLPYLIFQKLFKPRSFSLESKSYSGTPNMRMVLDMVGVDVMQKSLVAPGFAPARHTHEFPRVPGPDEAIVLEGVSRTLAHWAKHSPPDVLKRALQDKRIKFISHNQSDDEKLKSITGETPARRLNSTRWKRHEANLIGFRQVLQAAEISRQQWGRAIGEANIVVAGAGLIGGQLVEALLALGIAPQKILVVDHNPKVTEHFAERGCQVHDKITSDATNTSNFEHAVVFHATTGQDFDHANVSQYAKNTIFISMVTGGGVDLSQLKEKHGNTDDPLYLPELRGHSSAAKVWQVGYDQQYATHRYYDRAINNDGRSVKVIADGFPPNLLEEQWAKRFELTTMLVIASVLEAACGDGHSTIPDDLDELALNLFRQFDDAVEHRFKGYTKEQWDALLADFHSP